jgi:hypothetical protein
MQADAAVMDERPKKRALQLQQVPVQYLGAVLPHVTHWLASVVERSGRRYTFPILVEMIARGELQMWLIGDDNPRGIVITELYYAPSGLKFAAIRAAVGEGAEGWMPLISILEEWAKAEGCVGIDALARKGWARRLPDYKLTHVFLEKELA